MLGQSKDFCEFCIGRVIGSDHFLVIGKPFIKVLAEFYEQVDDLLERQVTADGVGVDLVEAVGDHFGQVDAAPVHSQVHGEHLQEVLGAQDGLTDGVEDEAGTVGGGSFICQKIVEFSC